MTTHSRHTNKTVVIWMKKPNVVTTIIIVRRHQDGLSHCRHRFAPTTSDNATASWKLKKPARKNQLDPR